MKITDVQKRKRSLLAIYIDGEYALDIDRKTFEEFSYCVSFDITDEQLHELIKLSGYNRAKSRALYLLSRRDYSSKELLNKLKEETDDDTAGEAVAKMEQLGYINDESYAGRYTEYLLKNKLYSIQKVQYELVKKGIDKWLIEDILSEFAPNPQEQIRELIEKKYKNKCLDEKGKRQTVAGLQRMGYNWQDIKKVLDEYFVLNYGEDE